MSKQICVDFLNTIHNLNPWRQNFRIYPETIWRDIKAQIIIYMRCVCDGEFTEIWNKFYHAISIPSDEIAIVDENTNVNLCNQYDLAIGDRYWIQPEPLMIDVSGDQYPVKHVPHRIKNQLSAVIVKVHCFDHENLHQTLMIVVPFIISGLSQYNPLIAELYHRLVSKLQMQGKFSFYSKRSNCKICVNYYVYHNGDWPWKSSITLRCMSHGSTFPYIYWIHFHDGKYWIS